MQRLSIVYIILLVVLLQFFSCGELKKKEKPTREPERLKEALLKANQALSDSEEKRIQAFLDRYRWPVKKTASGLYYYIYASVDEPERPVSGSTITAAYRVQLLNGQVLYDSEKDGLLRITLGKGEAITGLEEGIFLLGKGEKAKFIIPSHLAFGLLGDQKKIPQRASLVYDVSLVSFE
ncbi:MAG TPA: FKBP-type peptidyl-prolyl cis-trans isomerase [Bacteroidales bacterium]|nr:FKBP-type peptidyl-prolyl cis-trans isomerase [Bacteroidales bacterium]HSA42638.1 FKBP-type peptidyl-prolyl cis-trans isomerase [Bacteroidales bacterium]